MSAPFTQNSGHAPVLPIWLQPVLTSLTGKPLKGEFPRTLSPLAYLATTVTLLCVSLILPVLGLSLVNEQPFFIVTIFLLPFFWLVAAGQMRKLQVVVGHHCVHRVFLRSRPRLNDGLLELVCTLLLVQSANEYRRDHLGHHSRTLFTTREDADAAFLHQLGFRPGTPVATSRRLLWMTLFSFRFHGIFMAARLRSAMGKKRSGVWRVITFVWVTGLFIGLPLLIGLWTAVAVVWIPLIVVYQCSALLQFLTEHAWLRTGKAPEGKVDYAQRCWGRFLGERCPSSCGSLATRIFAWSGWWTRMLMFHAPVRLSCLVGDLPAHDWHHLCGYLGGDPARWTHSLFDRQAAIDANPSHPLAEQMASQELWGLGAMLNHVFFLLAAAEVPRDDLVPFASSPKAQEALHEAPTPTIQTQHEKSELHSNA